MAWLKGWRVKEFVHLHVHSEYSLLDSLIRIESLPERVRALGMKAVAVTDSDALYGLADFEGRARACGVQPILGAQLTLGGAAQRVLLLAEEEVGYRHLMRLASHRALTPERSWPSREAVAASAKGLTLLLGRESDVGTALEAGRIAEARQMVRWWQEAFGSDHLYLEVQDHGLAAELSYNRELMEFGRQVGLQSVATNAARYFTPEQARAHRLLRAIAVGQRFDPAAADGAGASYDLKDPSAMAATFAAYPPELLRNSLAIAERCQVRLPRGRLALPPLPGESGESPEQQLRRLCQQRLGRRYTVSDQKANARLEHELAVICAMGYAGYFLIVADFVDWAKGQGIAVGPGRGSAAGSVVAYVLGVTDVDPLRYGLLFERFLNPARISMPDMDIDIEDARREEVIAYVRRRYGEDRVAQIITFGTLAARAALRDVAKALRLPESTLNQALSAFKTQPQATLEQVFGEDATQPEALAQLIGFSKLIEGLPRHLSVHAAGVVIAPCPLIEVIPLERSADGPLLSQYPMQALAELGLLKMDFLGLRTLSVLAAAERMVARQQPEFALGRLPTDDPQTFAMLSRADTVGLFQLESRGMKAMLRQLRPSCVEHLMAAVSLFRPGPIAQAQRFIAGRHGQHFVVPAEVLRPILSETYGVLLYQEQIMQVAAALAGYTLGEADLLRRAISKKQRQVLADEEARFVEGCRRQGHSEATAREVYGWILKFAEYGFPKAHGAAYGLLAYRSAYLKARHPAAFYAALLSSVLGDGERIRRYAMDARLHDVPLLRPSLVRSEEHFSVEGKAIRTGLGAIRSLGPRATAALLARRPQGADWQRQLQGAALTSRAIDALLQSGALDDFGNRQNLQQALQNGPVGGLFDQQLTAEPSESPPGASSERIAAEIELLGFHVSPHPLETLPVSNASSSLAQLQAAGAGSSGHLTLLRLPDRAPSSATGAFRVSDPTGWINAAYSAQLRARRPIWAPASVRRVRAQVAPDGARLLIEAIESGP